MLVRVTTESLPFPIPRTSLLLLFLLIALVSSGSTVGAVSVDAAGGESGNQSKPPHILFILVDDLGWGNVGYHRMDDKGVEIRTPRIDQLVKEGIELDRHYTAPMCTPTRSALQSGRLPVHVEPGLAHPCSPEGGMYRNMTGIAQKLKEAGYKTHQVGKWDAGMASFDHIPKGRGYDTSLNYFGHGNWMWSHSAWKGSYNNRTRVPVPDIFDLWETDAPYNNGNSSSACHEFEEWLFRERIEDILEAHFDKTNATARVDPDPLFLFYAPRMAHYPLQAPKHYQDKFQHIKEPHRRVYAAMVSVLDDQVGYITDLLKEKGVWDDTLVVLSSDNGGFTGTVGPCNETEGGMYPWADSGTSCFSNEAGANNYPLRGGKYSHFEGGVRATAFVSGGFVPDHRRGAVEEGLLTIADWYTTFCGLANIDPHDSKAEKHGLPPVDGLNMWPLLSGKNKTSPRSEFLISDTAMIQNQWKLLVGDQYNAGWAGPRYPNATSEGSEVSSVHQDCNPACLFNVVEDPSEFTDLAAEDPELVASLVKRLGEIKASIVNKDHSDDPLCRETALQKYGGTYGPWIA